MQKKKKKTGLLGLFIKIAVIATAGWLLYTYVICFYRMDGNNMFPAVRDGDLCFILKTEIPRLDDIVLWKDDNEKMHLGRVVAAEGREVVIGEEGLVVDGYAPPESIFYETKPAENSEVKYPLKLNKGCYFLMNDHREEFSDSRIYGEVNIDNIVGKVFFLFRRRGF